MMWATLLRMINSIYIVGKNKSILTFPADFFAGKDSIGLNEAAWIFNTKRGYSMYPIDIKNMLAHGFKPEQLIGIRHDRRTPIAFEGVPNKPNEVEGLGDYLWFDRGTYLDVAYLGPSFLAALSGNKRFSYRVKTTVLHHVIFYCVATGHKSILL